MDREEGAGGHHKQGARAIHEEKGAHSHDLQSDQGGRGHAIQ